MKLVIGLFLKPQPNDRNMPIQHIPTLLGATCCVRLATALRCVATCWVLLAQNLKMVKFEPTTPNMSQQGGQTHTTCYANNVAICYLSTLQSFGRGVSFFFRLRQSSFHQIVSEGVAEENCLLLPTLSVSLSLDRFTLHSTLLIRELKEHDSIR